MLGDDAVVQPFVQLWATVYRDGAATYKGDGLYELGVGGVHLSDFSKAGVRMLQRMMNLACAEGLISRVDSCWRIYNWRLD
jgi:hypothetical protein